jgi:hypothetical protein
MSQNVKDVARVLVYYWKSVDSVVDEGAYGIVQRSIRVDVDQGLLILQKSTSPRLYPVLFQLGHFPCRIMVHCMQHTDEICNRQHPHEFPCRTIPQRSCSHTYELHYYQQLLVILYINSHIIRVQNRKKFLSCLTSYECHLPLYTRAKKAFLTRSCVSKTTNLADVGMRS